MDIQRDSRMEFGRLKYIGSTFRRFLRFVLATKFAVFVIVFFGLSGCMSSVPSTFPDIQIPSPQSSASVPSPSSSSGPPSGSPSPSQPNSGSSSSMPTPSLPTPSPPSSGDPSLPTPPSPIPSPESSNGSPSMPTLPSPDSQGDPNAGESNDGTTTPESSTGNEGQQDDQEGSARDNMELPPGDVQFPAGDPNGQPDGEQSSDGGGMMLPEDEGDGGWETSNQLEPQSGDAEDGGSGDEEEDENTTASGSGEDEMQRVLGDLDGEIMNERNAANTRANEEIAEAGSFETESDEDEYGAQDGETDGSVPTANDDQQARTGAGEEDEPLLPETQQGVADTPDATDKNVVARQLKEAALAEEDPELKEKLWEEYEDYVDGLK